MDANIRYFLITHQKKKQKNFASKHEKRERRACCANVWRKQELFRVFSSTFRVVNKARRFCVVTRPKNVFLFVGLTEYCYFCGLKAFIDIGGSPRVVPGRYGT